MQVSPAIVRFQNIYQMSKHLSDSLNMTRDVTDVTIKSIKPTGEK